MTQEPKPDDTRLPDETMAQISGGVGFAQLVIAGGLMTSEGMTGPQAVAVVDAVTAALTSGSGYVPVNPVVNNNNQNGGGGSS
jgi:hypothetical protein